MEDEYLKRTVPCIITEDHFRPGTTGAIRTDFGNCATRSKYFLPAQCIQNTGKPFLTARNISK